MLLTGDAARYERWRGLWLDGADSGVIAVLRFHGLRKALAVARLPGRPPVPGILPVWPGPVPGRVIDEAATLMRQLLDGTRGERHA